MDPIYLVRRYKTKHLHIDVDVLLKENTSDFHVFVTEKRKYISTFWETDFSGNEYDYIGNIPTKSARRWLKQVINEIKDLYYERVLGEND